MHILIATRLFTSGGAPSVAAIESILDFAARLNFTPDPHQARLLSTGARHVIVNCTRQWGKTTVTALRAAWHALRHPGSLILIAAPSTRQSGEFARKVESFLRRLSLRLRGDGANRNSITLPNGSRIVAVPGREATIRGVSGVSFLIVDEAARASDSLYDALRPMLATTNGDIWLLSTPNGKRGFFYQIWTHGGDAWDRHAVTAADCPRISPEFLERERQSLDEDTFRREYMGEFVLGEGCLFDRDLLEAAVSGQQHAWKDSKPA